MDRLILAILDGTERLPWLEACHVPSQQIISRLKGYPFVLPEAVVLAIIITRKVQRAVNFLFRPYKLEGGRKRNQESQTREVRSTLTKDYELPLVHTNLENYSLMRLIHNMKPQKPCIDSSNSILLIGHPFKNNHA